jgi:hypothetical protein
VVDIVPVERLERLPEPGADRVVVEGSSLPRIAVSSDVTGAMMLIRAVLSGPLCAGP